MSSGTSAFQVLIGRLMGSFLVTLVIAYPFMVLVNYAFAPATLIALFGGYLSYWKAVCVYAIFRALSK
jgi:hypothetical protein